MLRRTTPPIWLWVFWTLVLLVIVLLRTGVLDPGDSGFTNVFTMALTMLAALAGLGWFVFRSGFTWRTRLGVVGVLVLVLFAISQLVEVTGFSGAMVPIVRLRGSGPGVDDGVTAAMAVADVSTTTPYDFTGYLGSDRDLRVDNVELARDWEVEPPELLWKQPIGFGWGGFAVVNGYATTIEERDGRELVTMYDARTGELLWAHEIGGSFMHALGGRGPRSTPTIDEGRVYAMGVRGHLVVLDGAAGDVVWERDLLQDYGISLAEEDRDVAYGRPTSPLIVGDRLIVGVGGSAERRVSVVAYDKRHGEVLWEGGSHNVSMASPGHATLLGTEQVLMVNENWVSGHDLATGAVLWEFDWPGLTNADSNVSQAVALPPDRVFISKGYGGGAAMYRLSPSAGGEHAFAAEQLWHHPTTLRTKITNVAVRDGHAYGLSEGILECVNLDTGERVWKAGRYHHGQILMVGEVLLVLSEDGELFMVEATPERRNNVLGQFQAIDGHTWNTFALYGDIVVVRNGQEAAAYRLPLAAPLAAAPEPGS